MKTEISTFCENYKGVLNPLVKPLSEAVDCLQAYPRAELFERDLGSLVDCQNRYKMLIDKVEHQQAYLIIFGPLKSGKSTLMNAISGSYVSEVTSLPAYPCLVYVQHGEKPGFSVTRYNGTKSTYSDNQALESVLANSHSSLAERIRVQEEKDEEFDPGVHFTEAIRRIDVSVPVRALKESSTVLVDTPGLYSKMKFGYDLMTREFRDSAACAVFVVKPENLFLEQVFAEFNRLLDLFSRIFLVLNIDTSKRDLRPDGSLGESLESKDPQRIVEAFKSLSMTAPLRNAYDEGRLCIYPIDLLQAAIDALGGARPGLTHGKVEAKAPEPVEKAAEDDATEGDSEATEVVPAEPEKPNHFGEFVTDLTEYLNSSHYILEFKRDTLRQGGNICSEIKRRCNLGENVEFQKQHADLEQRLGLLASEESAAGSLTKLDLSSAFEKVSAQITDRVETLAKASCNKAEEELKQTVADWLASNESLRQLRDDRFGPIIKKLYEGISEELGAALYSSLDTPTGGAEFNATTQQQLKLINFEVTGFAREIIEDLKKSKVFDPTSITIDPEQVPVKRTFWDIIFFRSQVKVRNKLLGVPELDAVIPLDNKIKRLPAEVEGVLVSIALEFLSANLRKQPLEFASAQLVKYTSRFQEKFSAKIQAIQSELAGQLSEVRRKKEENQRVIDALERLSANCDAVDKKVAELTKATVVEPAS